MVRMGVFEAIRRPSYFSEYTNYLQEARNRNQLHHVMHALVTKHWLQAQLKVPSFIQMQQVLILGYRDNIWTYLSCAVCERIDFCSVVRIQL